MAEMTAKPAGDLPTIMDSSAKSISAGEPFFGKHWYPCYVASRFIADIDDWPLLGVFVLNVEWQVSERGQHARHAVAPIVEHLLPKVKHRPCPALHGLAFYQERERLFDSVDIEVLPRQWSWRKSKPRVQMRRQLCASPLHAGQGKAMSGRE